MHQIAQVLSPAEVSRIRERLLTSDWIDGNATSGTQSAFAKRNRQLPEDLPAAIELGGAVLDALSRSPTFVAAALPLRVFPPLFNDYGPGDAFDTHVDTAIRIRRGRDFRIRSDLSMTLFLTDPADYDGGELVIDSGPHEQRVKLPAGDLVLYPASTLHRVEPVTRGRRVSAFSWVQSMIRNDADRRTLFDLDCTVQALAADRGHDDFAVVRLTGIYHNLLRRWAEL